MHWTFKEMFLVNDSWEFEEKSEICFPYISILDQYQNVTCYKLTTFWKSECLKEGGNGETRKRGTLEQLQPLSSLSEAEKTDTSFQFSDETQYPWFVKTILILSEAVDAIHQGELLES